MKWFAPVVALGLMCAVPTLAHAAASKGTAKAVKSKAGTKSMYNPKELKVEQKVPWKK